MNKILVRLLISAIIAGLLVWWLVSQGFDVIPSWESIEETVAPLNLAIYVSLFSLFHILRAWRWTYLLRPFARVPTGTMMETAFAGFMAIQMMPLRTGEVARPYLLDKYTGASKSALFGTIAIERVIDGLMVSAWLTIALFTIPSDANSYVWGLRLVPITIFTVALALLIAFHHSPSLVSRLLYKILGLVSRRLADFAVGVIERFHGGLAAMPDVRNFWAFVVITAAYWCINAAAFLVLARGCGLDLPVAGAVAGMGILAVGILLPAGPGYFGNFQIAVLVALQMYIPDAAQSDRAAVFIFTLYFLQTGLTILFGAGGALALKRRPVVKRAAGQSTPSP